MGRPKQLLPLGDRTVIGHCIGTILSAGLMDLTVVLGSRADEIARTVSALPIRIVRNDQPESGMMSSVRIGLAAVNPGALGVLVCLVDHPLVSAMTMLSLVELYQQHPDAIVIPSFNRRRGHPTLFPRRMLDDIRPEDTLRSLINRHEQKVVYLNTADEGVLLDMDAPDDYAAILARFRG